MKLLKSSLALLVGASLLVGCDDETIKYVEPEDNIKFATFNLSFDRNNLEDLVEEMQVAPEEQIELVNTYLDNTIADEDKVLAERIIQIRNVAAIIQKNRPHVLMMAEFNNDGVGEDLTALKGFQTNYLSQPQSVDGAGGEPNLEPIEYPFFESYATNTGLASGHDLDNDGSDGTEAGDSWGFGWYHGQYAFALMSQYEIDKANTRTFQEFKWKDLEGATNPTITICDGSEAYPDGMTCGDNWYSDETWEVVRLSSKNHVDAPIIIPTEDGEERVHLLMSHPTPPVFDPGKNQQMNAAEVEFWQHYINGSDSIYDDNGASGGLGQEAKFVIMGDLNLERWAGDGIQAVMEDLHNDPLLNQTVMNGALYPVSFGAAEHAVDESESHPYPNRMTSTFGLGVDYAMPSATLDVKASGVYWSASYEEGNKLFKDPDVGSGTGKSISSDHRMVWIEAQF